MPWGKPKKKKKKKKKKKGHGKTSDDGLDLLRKSSERVRKCPWPNSKIWWLLPPDPRLPKNTFIFFTFSILWISVSMLRGELHTVQTGLGHTDQYCLPTEIYKHQGFLLPSPAEPFCPPITRQALSLTAILTPDLLSAQDFLLPTPLISTDPKICLRFFSGGTTWE